ncbi:MAG: hypothetical protein L0287_24740 [Anaerolineae bacterium]|nr:hypothetical protein [Anaerolineae bacterium]
MTQAVKRSGAVIIKVAEEEAMSYNAKHFSREAWPKVFAQAFEVAGRPDHRWKDPCDEDPYDTQYGGGYSYE